MCRERADDFILNANERENVIRCAFIEAQAALLLEADSPTNGKMWSRNGNSKYLRMIRTLANKVLVEALCETDKAQQESIRRYIENFDVEIKPSLIKVAKQKEMIMIPMEMFHEIRDLYMVDCLGCEKDKHAIKKCDLRRKLLRFGLIMPGEDVKDKPCPYMEEL